MEEYVNYVDPTCLPILVIRTKGFLQRDTCCFSLDSARNVLNDLVNLAHIDLLTGDFSFLFIFAYQVILGCVCSNNEEQQYEGYNHEYYW